MVQDTLKNYTGKTPIKKDTPGDVFQ